MAKGEKYDHAAAEVIKTWDFSLKPDAQPGSYVRHGDRWFTLVRFDGSHVVLTKDGIVERVPAKECRRQWDPDVDPQEFARRLTMARKRRIKGK